MLLFADPRSFSTSEDRFQHCTVCGKDLVVLPNDRRGGACFDCLSLSALEFVECIDCGAPMLPSQRIAGCPRCGWYARAT
jgi:hypothetical protein